MKNAASLVINKLPGLYQALGRVASKEVLVGVPQDETERQSSGEMTNASLAYIHDKGSPAANIPARPFMEPGIKAVSGKIAALFKQSARNAAYQSEAQFDQTLMKIGLIAQASIKNTITAGLEPPLADSTIAARARKGSKGAQAEKDARAAGMTPSVTSVKPLIATGQLLNSINFVVRRRK